MRMTDYYKVFYKGRETGYYSVFDSGETSYYTARGCPWDIGEELKELGLDKEIPDGGPVKVLTDVISGENRVPGSRKRIYEKGDLRLERSSEETDERFMVYRRSAEEGDAEYSGLPHDAPHYEGPKTPEGMREWANWYSFTKMDDGTFQADLDEAWWWGGGHDDGGTIHTPVPEEWFALPYEQFLEELVTLAAAAHYGFTPEILLNRKGLREFFGYGEDGTYMG